MHIGKTLTVAIGLILVALSPTANAKNYQLSATGWSVGSAAADIDGSLDGGFVADESGKGTFGKFTQQTTGDTTFSGSFCSPTSIELSYIGASSILRAANGDLLYRTLSSSGPSRICFDFVEEEFEFEVYLDVVGGTGRFEGATGSAIQSGKGKPVGARQSGVELSETGELTLVRREDEVDDEED